jgi:high affinity Mn2+ porin
MALSATPSEAADLLDQLPASMPTRAPIDEWSGFYFGGHIGFATAGSSFTATQPGAPALTGSVDLFHPYDFFIGEGSNFGGFQFGYNAVDTSGLILGLETDISFPGLMSGMSTFAAPSIGTATYSDQVDMSGSVRARIGYAFDRWLYYGTAGYAWTQDNLTRTQLSGASGGTVESKFPAHSGWTVGAGIEAPLLPHWTTRLEYLYSDFGTASVTFPSAGQRFDSNLSLQQIRVGLNYKFSDGGSNANSFLTAPAPPEGENWAIHAQTTFASQYAVPFHAPYRGANILDPNSGRETWDATLYAGLKLWPGAEVWFNPEINQGFGLSNTHGIAGFPNGNAYKVGADDPYLRVPRYFVRQTIDLGGDTEKVKDDLNQFAGSQSSNRVVLTVGKFAAWDWFDTNKYAHEPRSDFMNWALIDTGTWDYAADSWGYTYGAVAEWYQGPWTLRGGLLDLSIVPNNPELDPTFKQFQWMGEVEHHHDLWGQPGMLMITGFLTRGRMGRYDDALNLAALTGDTPDTALVRRYASRAGAGLNLEQQIVPNVGVFGRLGWADGNVEPYEFTDVDRTAAAGMSLSGKAWGRPDDTFGLAGVVNGISAAHIAYLNAGGLGILVGDGQLPHPGLEQIIETYYSFGFGSWQASIDYQFIANPGYNRDHGPVSVIGTRLHAQF